MKPGFWIFLTFWTAIVFTLGSVYQAFPHDIYTTLHSSGGFPCCNGRNTAEGVSTGDCEPTLAKAQADGVLFFVEGKDLVLVPTDQVQFIPLKGEEGQVHPDVNPPGGIGGEWVWGHFCGRHKGTDE